MEGSTLHMVIGSSGLLLHHMLLGHVQLDVAFSYVGMLGGSASIMLCSMTKSSRGLIMLAELCRCLLSLGSHSRW